MDTYLLIITPRFGYYIVNKTISFKIRKINSDFKKLRNFCNKNKLIII